MTMTNMSTCGFKVEKKSSENNWVDETLVFSFAFWRVAEAKKDARVIARTKKVIDTKALFAYNLK